MEVSFTVRKVRQRTFPVLVQACLVRQFLSYHANILWAVAAVRDDSPSTQDHCIDWDEERTSFFLWVRRLWVPLLMVMTVAMGWHYPLSLGINLVFLLWSTKPTPSSIYIWVEQVCCLPLGCVWSFSKYALWPLLYVIVFTEEVERSTAHAWGWPFKSSGDFHGLKTLKTLDLMCLFLLFSLYGVTVE